ncbi:MULTISPECIES: MBL fold metallo-hydrolase [unclassified Frankia]|nr:MULTISPECIES: MBL fold metallo-hydrolase [unclassified Frankia]
MVWSPISTTLIYGERDAVLVDPPFTIGTTREVLAWVEKIGRTITQIYITHGHGDHYADRGSWPVSSQGPTASSG